MRSRHERLAEFALENLCQRLRKNLPSTIIMGEPNPSPLERAQGQFRFQVMLRASNSGGMMRYIKSVMRTMTFPEETLVLLDMDAYQLC